MELKNTKSNEEDEIDRNKFIQRLKTLLQDSFLIIIKHEFLWFIDWIYLIKKIIKNHSHIHVSTYILVTLYLS